MKNKKLIFIFIILLLLVLFAGTAIRPSLLSTNITMADSGTVFNVPSERYKITRTNQYPTSQNYYNDFNQQFVKFKVTNLDLITYENRIFYFEHTNQLIPDGYTMTFEYPHYSYKIVVRTVLNTSSNRYTFFFDVVDFVFEEFELDIFNFDYLEFPFFTYDLYQKIYYKNLINVCIYGGISINIDIDYNNQFFYNKLLGLNFYHTLSDTDDVWDAYSFQTNTSIIFYDNGMNAFKLTDHRSSNKNCFFLLSNNYSYVNSYVNKISFTDFVQNDSGWKGCSFGAINSFNCIDFLCYRYYFDFHDGSDTPFLYSGNSDGQDGLSSTLIPSGSNTFYKSAPWYDIPAQLYNLLIYIVFDAPLVSNITQAVYSVIQLFVGTFKFLISLFVSVNNVFFITAIVGFLVLRFITAKILGGS